MADVTSASTNAAKTIARANSTLMDVEPNAAIESFPAPKWGEDGRFVGAVNNELLI
jgi:hypothetical protein